MIMDIARLGVPTIILVFAIAVYAFNYRRWNKAAFELAVRSTRKSATILLLEQSCKEARKEIDEWKKVAECASIRADDYEKRLRDLGEKRGQQEKRRSGASEAHNSSELQTYMMWASATPGSPEWLAYWRDGGDQRYRSLLERASKPVLTAH